MKNKIQTIVDEVAKKFDPSIKFTVTSGPLVYFESDPNRTHDRREWLQVTMHHPTKEGCYCRTPRFKWVENPKLEKIREIIEEFATDLSEAIESQYR